MQALRKLSDQLQDEQLEEKSIDFSQIGLYIAGLQMVSAIVACSITSILGAWLVPPAAVSAVRTLAATTIVGLICVHKPLRVGRVRGVGTIFNALRPCVPSYILSLVLEQLVHTCVAHNSPWPPHNVVQGLFFHSISLLLLISGFVRARLPRAETDGPFLLAFVCVLALAFFPPPAVAGGGPLCSAASLFEAGERVLRALLFSTVYAVSVYAAAPSMNSTNELFICVARATAASIWVLVVTNWALTLAPLQVAIVLFSRLHDMGDENDGRGEYHQTESVPLRAPGSMTPIHSTEGSGSDLENGSYTGEAAEAEALKLAIASTKPSKSNGTHGNGINGISFQFNRGPSPSPSSLNMAAVAAREAAREMNGV